MGIGAGKFRPFIRDDKIQGHGKFTLVVARNLKLTNLQVDRLYHEFTKFSDPVTHKMGIEDLFAKYKVEFGLGANFLFQLWDKKKTGELDFCQYIIVLWSILTTDQDSLVSFYFAAFDTERMGSLDITEVDFMISLIWDFKPPDDVRMAVKHLNKNADSVVTVAEVALLVRHYPFLVHPVTQMRDALKKKIVFLRFWEEVTAARYKNFSYRPFFDIIQALDETYVLNSLEYLTLQSTTPLRHAEQVMQ
jgi:Ca2+-binding EF-hand superfamily protein